jgi:MFS family permease
VSRDSGTKPASDVARDQFRRLTILIAVAFVDMIGFAMVFPLLPFYALKLHAQPQTIGFIIAAFSGAQLISAPIWGRVSDRYGRRPALLIGLSASAVAFTVFGFANSVWLLFLSRFVQGAGGGTTGVTQAYIADTVRPEDRARSLGWISAATNLGTMLGPVIGSFASQWGQTVPGLLAASLCICNVVFAWKWLPESKKLKDSKARRKPVWHSAWMVIRHPKGAVQRMTLIYAAGMLANAAMTSVLALYLGAEFGVTERTIGYVFLYVGVFSVIMRSALIGPIVDRIGELWSIRAGTASLILGLIGYPMARSFVTLAFIIPLVPIGLALLFPATTALMSRASEASELGTTMGTAQTFAGLSRVIAPLFSTTLFQQVGHGAPFLFSATIMAGISLLSFQMGTVSAHEPVHVVD